MSCYGSSVGGCAAGQDPHKRRRFEPHVRARSKSHWLLLPSESTLARVRVRVRVGMRARARVRVRGEG